MAHRRNSTQSANGPGLSSWAVPGGLLGAYVLTRLPFGMLAGLALGFAAGWTLRSEHETGQSARPSRFSRDEEPSEEDVDKVDAMSDESFPASDPPSYTPTRTGKPKAG